MPILAPSGSISILRCVGQISPSSTTIRNIGKSVTKSKRDTHLHAVNKPISSKIKVFTLIFAEDLQSLDEAWEFFHPLVRRRRPI